MANQTITTDTNHDALIGRLPGEDITINSGAVLTIDSMPQHTAMGILGDIQINNGEIRIDGRYVREVVYSSGSGALPAVGATVTWNSSAGSGKVIRLNSGTNASGIMTITVQSGSNPTGTITNGSWSATLVSEKVGLLMVFGEDQVWDALDATATLRITGDWYQIGVGDGTNSQSITLPHSGIQHAIWVETGNGTNVFEIWHRVYNGGDSSVFFDSLSDWGNTFESGYVFAHVPGTSTLTFGTSSNGGAPANGARIRIPNVHMGTTTTASPFAEVISLTLANYLEILDSAVSENVAIDHLNASTVQCSLVQTNNVTIADSSFGLWNTANFINRNNAAVSISNCAFISGNSLAGDSISMGWIILDNVGGITLSDCVWYGGVNGTNANTVALTTMANITFNGINKIVSNQQDENTMTCIRATTSSVVTFNGQLITLNGGIITSTGCVDWYIEDFRWGQLTSRGSTEDSITVLNLGATDTLTIDGGQPVSGGATTRDMNAVWCLLNDCANITVRNFGTLTNKIDCGGRGTSVVSLTGITNNCKFQRLFFTNRNTASPFLQVNSCADITFENCSCDYNDELEPFANRCLMKGVHGASGNIGSATGVEDDYVNVLASIFMDYFKSDTTGSIGLVFNERGQKHLADVSIDNGNPIWNGIGDLLMPSLADQVTFTFPYQVLGHTGFQNVQAHIIGVNAGTIGVNWGNFSIEYALDTGSGFGAFKVASGANLSAETISPEGFGLKIRIKVTTANSTNNLRGLALLTTTTLADQAANLYPLDVVTITLNNVVTGSVYEVFNVTTAETLTTGIHSSPPSTPISISTYASNNDIIRVRVRKSSASSKYLPFESQSAVSNLTASYYVSQIVDEVIG